MWSGDQRDKDEARRMSIELALAQHTGATKSYSKFDDADEDDDDASSDNQEDPAPARPSLSEDNNDTDDEEDGDDISRPEEAVGVATEAPRGKPQAVAARLASAARLQEKMEELEAEQSDDVVVEAVVDDDDPMDQTMDTLATVDTLATAASTASSAPPKKKKKRSPATKKKSSAAAVMHPTMDDPVKPITDVEYVNLQNLMVQFCRVPLLAEFSRPVSLLHPELMHVYSKIVDHPIDLGLVCRQVRKQEYSSLRDVQLDTWRIFSNCVRFHSHHSNKQAVPSFVSIALHLRNYFNSLWQEHLLPSDPPPASTKTGKSDPDSNQREAFAKRVEARKQRLVVSGLSVMTGKSLARASHTLGELLDNGGCVDQLDTTPIFGPDSNEEDDDLDIVVENFNRLKDRLKELSGSGADYGIDELESDVKKCYTHEVLENNPGLQMRIAHRLDRWIGKIVVPIYEATCRGVGQSSIWGCMAAAVWARESSKKPYWPALVLGIMAPDHQREDWHAELTLRNESRLPEKLKTQLIGGKRKADASLKKQTVGHAEPQSFFLVEFLGTHEFIWVREADIVEDFSPSEDPNQNVPPPNSSKKKRASRSNIANVIGSKTYASAVEEAQWALEEFELQLQDVGNDAPEDDDEGYSYPVLCQSDEEADDADAETDKRVDLEELNELLATDGLIDLTANGRKNAKKRAQAVKKQKADAEKKLKADKAKKLKAEQNKKKKDAKAKERESKKEQKELEKKRKKRAREREKVLKGSEPKPKKRRLDADDAKKSNRRNIILGKRERAAAIVDGYLNRAIERSHYKSLCLGGVMSIPAAMIDSSGLFGMTMALRAAAGEIQMPEESGAQETNYKPWEAIKYKEGKKSKERVELLQKKIELMEKEIARIRNATAKRKELAIEAKKIVVAAKEKLIEDDVEARANPLKKKKTVGSAEKKNKNASKTSPEKEDQKSVGDASTADADFHDAAASSSEMPLEDTEAKVDGESSADEAMEDAVEDADGEERSEAEQSASDADGDKELTAEVKAESLPEE